MKKTNVPKAVMRLWDVCFSPQSAGCMNGCAGNCACIEQDGDSAAATRKRVFQNRFVFVPTQYIDVFCNRKEKVFE